MNMQSFSLVLALVITYLMSAQTYALEDQSTVKQTNKYSENGFSVESVKLGENVFTYIDEAKIDEGKREDKQTLIFLHGWSSDKYYWTEQVKHFAKAYRVIALDWRGQGLSTGGLHPYQFSDLIDDLHALIESLNLKTKPILVGHSMGGVQVMHFASRYPQQVKALVSVDAPGQDNFVTGRLMYWSMLAAFKATGFLSDTDAISLHVPVNRYLFYSSNFVEENSSKISQWEDQFKANRVASLIHSLQALTYRERLSEEIREVPALFVLGDEDRFISIEQTQAYQALFPGAKLKMIEGAGHMSSEEQPEVFNALLTSFLSQMTNDSP